MPDDYFNQPPTVRLRFERVTQAHVVEWTSFFEGNAFIHFIGQDPSLAPAVLAQMWVDRQMKRYAENGHGHLAAYDENNELVAMSGLLRRDLDEGEWTEIAYSVKPKHWGKGYATEMAKHWLKYGMEVRKEERLISLIHADNIASKKVAQKAGLQYVRDTVCKAMPANVYAITQEQYWASKK